MPDNRRERFTTVGEIRFSKNRDLVVSVLGDRVILGQRITFEDDGGTQGKAFLKNAPSLDVDSAALLIVALRKGIEDVERRSSTKATLTTTRGRE